jgi:hypothetical protein
MVVFSKHQKRRAVGLLLLGGGAIAVGGRLLQLQIRAYQKEQNALCEMYLTNAASKQPISRKPKVCHIRCDWFARISILRDFQLDDSFGS